jgi:sugar phosphate isomerase/epimerase
MLPLGLWLSARSAEQLTESIGGGAELRDRLAAVGLSIVTLNGFPYQDFHGSEVKLRVYEPHWANTRRALHTQRLADLLPDLLMPGMRTASISTLPLGWRALFSQEGCGASVGIASALLEQTVRHLARIEDRTGIRITVDLEPEPGCMLDRAADVVSFFEHALQPRRGEPDPRRYIGVCHDVCHAAVMFEDQRAVLRAYRTAGISVNKIQVSSAVVATGNAESLVALAAFSEPRYLHQTCVRSPDGGVTFFEDIPWRELQAHMALQANGVRTFTYLYLQHIWAALALHKTPLLNVFPRWNHGHPPSVPSLRLRHTRGMYYQALPVMNQALLMELCKK